MRGQVFQSLDGIILDLYARLRAWMGRQEVGLLEVMCSNSGW